MIAFQKPIIVQGKVAGFEQCVREVKKEHDQARAGIAAKYTLDYIHKHLDGSTGWRASAPNGSLSLFTVIDDVWMFYTYVDQIDGNVNNDATQPFLVYAVAVVGDTNRCYRIELIPDEDGNLTRNVQSLDQVPFEDLFE